MLGHLKKRAISIFENQKMFGLVLALFDRKHDDPYFCNSILKDFHGLLIPQESEFSSSTNAVITHDPIHHDTHLSFIFSTCKCNLAKKYL